MKKETLTIKSHKKKAAWQKPEPSWKHLLLNALKDEPPYKSYSRLSQDGWTRPCNSSELHETSSDTWISMRSIQFGSTCSANRNVSLISLLCFYSQLVHAFKVNSALQAQGEIPVDFKPKCKYAHTLFLFHTRTHFSLLYYLLSAEIIFMLPNHLKDYMLTPDMHCNSSKTMLVP